MVEPKAFNIILNFFVRVRGSENKFGEQKSMKIVLNMFIIFLGLGLSSVSVAQEFYVYPAKGQSPEQTEKDKFECYNWAKGQTNFDPMQVPTASSPPPAQEPQKGGAGRGALAGAAGGAIIGGIADGKAGEGAAIGAIAGGLFGGARRSKQQQQQQAERQQWEQQQANQYANARNQYNRAYVACLEARDYSVK